MISVVMAYHQRPEHLKITLDSYKHHYPDIEVEVIVIEDTPNDGGRLCERVLSMSGLPYKHETVDRSGKLFRNPGVLYNQAVDLASHDIIHLTNPENLHHGPILKHCLDYITDDNYIVYACRTLSCQPDTFEIALNDIDSITNWSEANGWYQHTLVYNRLLHFASVINKNLYTKIGGFDPRFDDGTGYEDNDFIMRIKSKNIDVLVFDEPFAGHQAHNRDHWFSTATMSGFEHNQNIYRQIWNGNTIENWSK